MQKDRLSFFDGGFLGKPTRPTEETTSLLSQSNKLDHFLAVSLTSMERLYDGDIQTTPAELLHSKIQLHTGEKNHRSVPIKDIEAYRGVVQGVSDWMIVMFHNLHLDEEQKKVLRAGPFENDLGRAGLSILVEICSLILSEKCGIDPITFAQGKLLPLTTYEVSIFKEGQTYMRHYKSDGVIPQRVKRKDSADGFVTCSYSQLSMALIGRIEQIASSPEIASFAGKLDLKPSSIMEKAFL